MAVMPPVMAMPPAAMMPTVPAMVVMPVPPYFSGQLLLRVPLHRHCCSWIDQRRRLYLSQTRHHQQRANRREAENFRSVHPPLLQMCDRYACPVLAPVQQPHCHDAIKD